MVKILDFIFAARPMLLLPVWSIFLICLRFSINSRVYETRELILLAGISLIYIGAYYINQIFDYKTDLINKKLGFLQKGLISGKEMLLAFAITSILGFLGGFYYDINSGLTMIIVFFIGYAYSAPPFRLKDRPILGLLSNGVAYGILIPVSLIAPSNVIMLSHLKLPIYFFLTVSAIYLLTVIPDREGDLKSRKRTIALLLPDNVIITIGALLLLAACILAAIWNLTALAIIAGISCALLLVAFHTKSKAALLAACKSPILILSLYASYYFYQYFIFLIVLILTTRLYYRKRFGIVYPKLN
jgi:4-hydroxybenzoate polyprenyltransferase